MKKLIVHKYGGSSLSTPEKILDIAKKLGALHEKGHKLIVVVSAMGKSTDRLIQLAHQVSKTPDRREMDMLLSTGERVSMSLMSIALQSLDFPAISFTGSQSGILTTHTHNKARIVDIKPIRIEQALNDNKIVIVAGFQGVDPTTKEITTLGRGGSDTTAVTLAAHFKAQACYTLKDVNGVQSIDPKNYKAARLLKTISFASLKSMCFWGSPILHYRSVALSEKMSVPLFIGNSTKTTPGTQVHHKDNNMYEKTDVLAVNCVSKIIHLSIRCHHTGEGYELLKKFLSHEQLAMPQIFASAFEGEALRLMLTDSDETLSIIESSVKNTKNIELLNNDNSIVSLTFNGATDHDLIPTVTALLAENNIPVSKVITSPLTLAFVVTTADKDKALTTLHSFIEQQ